jgi:hypothetical protein
MNDEKGVVTGVPLCAVCRTAVDSIAPARCPKCEALYHAECWNYSQRCAIYGCDPAPGEPVPKKDPPPQRSRWRITPLLAVGIASLCLFADRGRYFLSAEEVRNQCVRYQTVLTRQKMSPDPPTPDFPANVYRPPRCSQDSGPFRFYRMCPPEAYQRLENGDSICSAHGSPNVIKRYPDASRGCREYQQRWIKCGYLAHIGPNRSPVFPPFVQRMPGCGRDPGPFYYRRPCPESSYTADGQEVRCAQHGSSAP